MPQRREKKSSYRKATAKETGKSFYAQQLKWLFHFMRAKIARINRPGFERLLFEVLDFLYGQQVEDKREIKNVSVDTPMNREALAQVQNLFNFWLKNILDESRSSLHDGTAHASSIGETAYKLRINAGEIRILPERRAHPYGMKGDPQFRDRNIPLDAGIEPDETYLNRYFFHNPGIDLSRYALFRHIYDPDIKTTILLSLIPLLEKFPLESIKSCLWCGNYFRATKKKKWDLCRPCIQKIHIYKSRRENPEAYNEYMRKLQKGEKDETPKQIRDRLARERERRDMK